VAVLRSALPKVASHRALAKLAIYQSIRAILGDPTSWHGVLRAGKSVEIATRDKI
jgi:hypothetical protein